MRGGVTVEIPPLPSIQLPPRKAAREESDASASASVGVKTRGCGEGDAMTAAAAGASGGSVRGARPSPCLPSRLQAAGFERPSCGQRGCKELGKAIPRQRHGWRRGNLGRGAGATAEPGDGAGTPQTPAAAGKNSEVTNNSANGAQKWRFPAASPWQGCSSPAFAPQQEAGR